MSEIDDGGPAFPTAATTCKGMSLRDWFAGQALAGMLSDPISNLRATDYAANSYEIADAMLAERKK